MHTELLLIADPVDLSWQVIRSPEMLLNFQKSDSYASLKSFILSLNSSCKGVPLSQDVPLSDSCKAVISILKV